MTTLMQLGGPDDPPGFHIRTAATQATEDNGYRVQHGLKAGGWLRYGSTTVPGDVWIGGRNPDGPWFLSIEHPGVAAELAAEQDEALEGPGHATLRLASSAALHHALDRVYRLASSLPSAPLLRYEARLKAELKKPPSTTEVERLVKQRVGQEIFRGALLDYWDGRCAVTGLGVPELLRASHIKPWADCETDAERLDVFNGLLLAPNLDAAFDRGFITFGDDGALIISDLLGENARGALGFLHPFAPIPLAQGHRSYLAWHRANIFKGDASAC